MTTVVLADTAVTRLTPLAPLTTKVFNPVMRLLAGWMPGLGVLTHHGRRTGREYHTPLLVLRRGDGYVVALWYGSSAHWVQNLVVDQSAGLRTRGRTVAVTHADFVADPGGHILPLALRLGARLLRVRELALLQAKEAKEEGTAGPGG